MPLTLNPDPRKEKVDQVIDHRLTVEEVCRKYGTSLTTGLDEREAAHRLERDGPNQFTPPKSKPWYLLFIRELTGGFALLLWFSGIASFVSYAIEKRIEDVSAMVTVTNSDPMPHTGIHWWRAHLHGGADRMLLLLPTGKQFEGV